MFFGSGVAMTAAQWRVTELAHNRPADRNRKEELQRAQSLAGRDCHGHLLILKLAKYIAVQQCLRFLFSDSILVQLGLSALIQVRPNASDCRF